MATLTIERMLGALVTVVVGVFLIPVIYNAVNSANITDATVSGLISLIPLMFSVAVVFGLIKGII